MKSENSAFLHILSTEGRDVGLCWAHSQPKGPKGLSAPVPVLIPAVRPPTCNVRGFIKALISLKPKVLLFLLYDAQTLQRVVLEFRAGSSGAFLDQTRALPPEREFFIDNLLVQIYSIIVMIRWTGLVPWEFESPFPGSLTSTFQSPVPSTTRSSSNVSLAHIVERYVTKFATHEVLK